MIAAGAGLLGAGLAGGLLVLLLPGPSTAPSLVAESSTAPDAARVTAFATGSLARAPLPDTPPSDPAATEGPGPTPSVPSADPPPNDTASMTPSDPATTTPDPESDPAIASLPTDEILDRAEAEPATTTTLATVENAVPPPGDESSPSEPVRVEEESVEGLAPPSEPIAARLVASGALAVPLTVDGVLLTTSTAVAGPEDAWEVELADGSIHLAVVVAEGEGFALLQLDHPRRDLTAFELAGQAPATGSWVTVQGPQTRRGVVVELDGRLALAGMGTAGVDLEGAPVVDAQGRVVGLSTHRNGTTHLVPVVDAAAIAGTRRDPSWLGVAVSTVAQERLTQIVVTDLSPGSPAQGRLESGDVILAIDDTEVSTALQLSRVLTRRLPGDLVTLTVRRAQEILSVEVTLGVRPVDL